MSTSITIELDAFHAAELEALARQLKASPGEVVALALDQLGHGPLEYTQEQIRAIEEGLAQLQRGEPEQDTDAVFSMLRQELGA